MKNPSVVVVGSLNTDLVVSGISKFAKPGQQVYADTFRIGPGGKSRNIAQMIATLTDKGVVAMIGKSVKDPHNLWRHPINSLRDAGVIIDYVKILEFDKVKKFPGIATILVDRNGNNAIYVIPGINDDFSKKDIDAAKRIIHGAQFLVVTLERPFETALYAVKVANKFNVKVLLDPGGISEAQDPEAPLRQKLFLLKPNEYEAEILSGIEVSDFASAKKAAKKLLSSTIENLLITHGKNGAYFFNKNYNEHIKIPVVKKSKTRDETGCGDQTMAGIVASLSHGKDILSSVKYGILAGTLQFYNPGIIPITKKEVNKYLLNGKAQDKK